MKKTILLILMIPLLGVTKKPEVIPYISDKRPTIEQQLQLSKNRRDVNNSQFYVELAELKQND